MYFVEYNHYFRALSKRRLSYGIVYAHKNVKSIRDLVFRFPLEKGLYAITGENASGKSTLVACAASVFYMMPMYDYIGRPIAEASIEFELNGATRKWLYHNNNWIKDNSENKMKINGFFEGSIIFGNRFKDTIFSKIRVLDKLVVGDLDIADDYVRKSLGYILHNNEEHYQNLYTVKSEVARKNGLASEPYCYIANGKLINQARMSTGENLLVSILHSLSLLRNRRQSNSDGRPCLVFLDEIELALHASSLRRLVHYLSIVSEECNLAIFFSTHSLELLRDIKPQNIFYLTRIYGGNIHVTNPCYPAYATRNLYSDDGYGTDIAIFVEDDVAKSILERILLDQNLLNNIRVKILPTGGWTNTITMAFDVITSRLLQKNTKVLIVLDKDIKSRVPDYLRSHKQYSDLKLDYLPLSSLEKYLKNKLIENFDSELYQRLDNYLFQRKPLQAILQKYTTEVDPSQDEDGKSLYGQLLNELRGMRKDRDELAEIVVKYIYETEKQSIQDLTDFLRKNI